ncbi:hypothetical protein [Alkalicoccobacillus porphyridii]|uniref:hypothetical protein n=1 Tax=Alkalicoccobacillus porphyridii TaxID=2597270 RepID=UPI00163DC8D0|nr:hypothetical protein [Alkalicoccobacillus porphyridii]
MQIEFFPEVTRLLENEPEKVTMQYMRNSWSMPTITVRPPYYKDPRIEPYYPKV